MDSISPFVKDVEILSDGSVIRSGTNFSEKVKEAHDASKASIQSRISNLESGGVNKGTGKVNPKDNPRYEPGVATESFNFRNSLDTQKKIMYQNGDIGIIPQEVRDKLAGREFRSFDEFRIELWKEVGNSSFADKFNKANQALMKQGFAPRAPKNGQYKSLNTYIFHHKQHIEKGGGVYDLDNLIIVSPRMYQEILDRSYHFGKKGASLKKHYRR